MLINNVLGEYLNSDYLLLHASTSIEIRQIVKKILKRSKKGTKFPDLSFFSE